jgi:hypothetical protein
MARTVEDVLARRTCALFLNARAAIDMAPLVGELMAEELGRDESWAAAQVGSFGKLAKRYLARAFPPTPGELPYLGQTRLRTKSSHGRNALENGATPAEADALAAASGDRPSVLVWHQADAWWAEGLADVAVEIAGLSFQGAARIRHWRLDGERSNANAEWVCLGEPQDPSPAQVARVKSRLGLEPFEPPQNLQVAADRRLGLRFPLPPFGAWLLEIEPDRAQ